MDGNDVRRIWREARENQAKRDGCKQHLVSEPYEPMARYQCDRCGASFDYAYLSAYLRGFEAAGGDPRVVWTGLQSGKN